MCGKEGRGFERMVLNVWEVVRRAGGMARVPLPMAWHEWSRECYAPATPSSNEPQQASSCLLKPILSPVLLVEGVSQVRCVVCV